jgi:hypothetical protein
VLQVPGRFSLSRLPPEECRRRLTAATTPDTLHDIFVSDGSEPHVLANLSERGFRLCCEGQVLYGKFATTPGGSIIHLEVRFHLLEAREIDPRVTTPPRREAVEPSMSRAPD